MALEWKLDKGSMLRAIVSRNPRRESPGDAEQQAAPQRSESFLHANPAVPKGQLSHAQSSLQAADISVVSEPISHMPVAQANGGVRSSKQNGDISGESQSSSSTQHMAPEHAPLKLQNHLIIGGEMPAVPRTTGVAEIGPNPDTRSMGPVWTSAAETYPQGGDSSNSRVVTLPTLCRVESATDPLNSAVDLRGKQRLGRVVAPFPPHRVPRVLRVLGAGKKLVVEGLPYGDRMSVLWATDVMPRPNDPFFPCVETESVTIEPAYNPNFPREPECASRNRGNGQVVHIGAPNGVLGCNRSKRAGDLKRTHGFVENEDCSCMERMSPRTKSNFVYQGDQWEILVQGMHVESLSKKYAMRKKQRDLILYSMEAENGDGGVAGVGAGGAEGAASGSGSCASGFGGGGGSSVGGRGAVKFESASPPVIHYDFKKDGQSHPDTYRAVPSSKALVTNDCGRQPRKTVKVRFMILEVDESSESAGAAIEGVEALTSQLAEASLQMPYVSVLTPAMRVASKLGQSALDSYAKPDHVISIDMSFRVLQRGCAVKQRSGDYLRYGYMFFLSKAVSYKLYASTRSSTSIRLMMRDMSSPAVRPFIPLKHVSYLVLKIGVPSEDLRRRRRPLGRDHARRLQDVCENVDLLGDRAACQRIRSIMSELNGSADSPLATHAELIYNGSHSPAKGMSR